MVSCSAQQMNNKSLGKKNGSFSLYCSFSPLINASVLLLSGVNTVTAHSASHPIFNVTSAISTTRRNPSSVTCATAASVSKPTSIAISRSTSTKTFLVSLQLQSQFCLRKLRLCESIMQLINRKCLVS